MQHHRKRRRSHDIEGHAHYLTFSCWRRQAFLSRDRTRAWLADAMNAARIRHPFHLWAYVIMPEHVHILVLPHGPTTIRRILQGIKQPVAQRAVAWARKHRPELLRHMADVRPDGNCSHRFWLPGGGYDRNIWTASELHEKIQYIHAKPVRRRLADCPGDWSWSSWRAWEEGMDEPIRIDRDSLPPIQG